MMQADIARCGEDDRTVCITLHGPVSARWVLLLILISIGVASELFPSLGTDSVRWFGESSNLIAIVCTVLLWSGSNLATYVWINALAARGQHIAGLHLVVDVVALAVLVALTGGAANPFTVLFVVPITLATQVSPRWTWGVALASVVSFGVLLELVPGDAVQHAHHASMGDHLRGMWLALGLAGALITYFVHRIALGIARQRDELARLRDAARGDRILTRIGSLAAGAAHELGTPLATLTVLAGELEHMQAEERHEAIAQMRFELARCKRIIGSMASSELRAEGLQQRDIEPWQLQDLGEDLASRASCTWHDRELPISFVPKLLVLGILRELAANARNAGAAQVDITGSHTDGGIHIQVHDDGPGMRAEVLAEATDPFFSTKQSPENMGLGLFLASAQLRSYGGRLDIESNADEGTTVSVYLPRKEKE